MYIPTPSAMEAEVVFTFRGGEALGNGKTASCGE